MDQLQRSRRIQLLKSIFSFQFVALVICLIVVSLASFVVAFNGLSWLAEDRADTGTIESGVTTVVDRNDEVESEPVQPHQDINHNQTETHLVVSGDTLWQIAADQFGDGLKYQHLVELNPDINNPDLIYPGQVIQLEVSNENIFTEFNGSFEENSSTAQYTVKNNDSLWNISVKICENNVKMAQTNWPILYRTNQEVIGDDPDLIYPGQLLTVQYDALQCAPK